MTDPLGTLAVKGRMNRITAQHAEHPDRPLLVRAAHKWYAWTGVALTVIGAYFAGNGQLRVGEVRLAPLHLTA